MLLLLSRTSSYCCFEPCKLAVVAVFGVVAGEAVVVPVGVVDADMFLYYSWLYYYFYPELSVKFRQQYAANVV